MFQVKLYCVPLSSKLGDRSSCMILGCTNETKPCVAGRQWQGFPYGSEEAE